MKDIGTLLSELAKGSTHIISSPDIIKELQKKGVPFSEQTPGSLEEVVENLFTQRKKGALINISKFPLPPDIAIPTIGFLYDEIRECMLFGLYGAAISLSSVLVEFSLKQAIVRKKHGKTYNADEWDRIEGIELGPTIIEAKNADLLDNDMEKALISFKNTVRNPYLHYNLKKITKNVGANKVKKINTTTVQIEELDLSVKDNPILWGFGKRFVDKERVFEVFTFADNVVKYLFEAQDKT